MRKNVFTITNYYNFHLVQIKYQNIFISKFNSLSFTKIKCKKLRLFKKNKSLTVFGKKIFLDALNFTSVFQLWPCCVQRLPALTDTLLQFLVTGRMTVARVLLLEQLAPVVKLPAHQHRKSPQPLPLNNFSKTNLKVSDRKTYFFQNQKDIENKSLKL